MFVGVPFLRLKPLDLSSPDDSGPLGLRIIVDEGDRDPCELVSVDEGVSFLGGVLSLEFIGRGWGSDPKIRCRAA